MFWQSGFWASGFWASGFWEGMTAGGSAVIRVSGRVLAGRRASTQLALPRRRRD